jgi:hypothetical protein
MPLSVCTHQNTALIPTWIVIPEGWHAFAAQRRRHDFVRDMLTRYRVRACHPSIQYGRCTSRSSGSLIPALQTNYDPMQLTVAHERHPGGALRDSRWLAIDHSLGDAVFFAFGIFNQNVVTRIAVR